MNISRFLFVRFIGLASIALLAGCATLPGAPSGPIPDDQVDIARSIGSFRERINKLEVLRHVHVFREMKKDVITKKVFVEFQGSPSMTMYVRQRLVERGYVLVDKKEDAENIILVKGNYGLQAAGRRVVFEDLGPMIEKRALVANANEAPEVRTESVPLAQVATLTYWKGSLDLPGIAGWVAEQTGLAAGLNKLLQGTPDGYCNGARCPVYQSTVLINVWSDRGKWVLEENAMSEKIALDILIPDAIDKALAPLLDLGQNANGLTPLATNRKE